ncbi:alpha/beta fold hydrolase [Spirosoma koreense]
MPYSVNNVRLNVLEAGQAQLTIVFLHYFGGSVLEWQAVMQLLSDQYRCLAIDLRGHGDSEAPAADYSVETMADDVRALLQVLEIQDFVLVGHSMGGKVALDLASRQPAGLRSVLLLAPSPPVPEPIPEADRQHMLDTHGQPAEARETLHKITEKPLSSATQKQIIADHLRTSDLAWKAWLTLGSREDISEQMASILVPVAIIAGTADRALPFTVQPKMTLPYLTSATLDTVQGAGHLLPWEVPDVVADFIRAKLALLDVH